MDEETYEIHQRLGRFPPGKLLYILWTRLKEQGLRSMLLWLMDKIVRRFTGTSPLSVSEVLPLLHVGGQQSKRGLKRLESCGVKSVVNMREESDDAARGAAPENYLWLPTVDDAAPSYETFKKGVEYIAEQIALGHGVYVHCAAGVGRAPMMAAAYLTTTGLEPAEAWAAIEKKRPFIRPTPPQVAAVEEFARRWKREHG